MSNTTRIQAFFCVLALSCTPTADGDAAAAATEPLRAGGQTCGGFAGLVCDDGLACFYATGSCGRNDQSGTCAARPEVCPFIYRPVCGCDGRTYPNRCEATRAGVSIAHHKACEEGEGEPTAVSSPQR